jgi:hypothetical protein
LKIENKTELNIDYTTFEEERSLKSNSEDEKFRKEVDVGED